MFRQKKDYNMLQEEKRQALEELLQLKKLHSQQQASSLEQSQKIRELHQELDAKEELVKLNKNIVLGLLQNETVIVKCLK